MLAYTTAIPGQAAGAPALLVLLTGKSPALHDSFSRFCLGEFSSRSIG